MARPTLPHALSLRLTTRQYALVQLHAEGQGVPLSRAVRSIIEQWADDHVDEETRALLGVAETITPDEGWRAAHGQLSDPGEADRS